MEERVKMAQASFSIDTSSPYMDYTIEPAQKIVHPNPLGFRALNVANNDAEQYREDILQCRYFYKYDPIASTVINRMGDMAITTLRVRRNECTDEEFLVYSSVLNRISPLMDACASDYLITGMAVPDYVVSTEMGSRFNPKLGRTRYKIPTSFWVRDPTRIILKRRPTSLERSVFIQISDEESYFIRNEGKYKDGTADYDAYRAFAREFPEYVQLVKEGTSKIPLPNSRAILRKVQSDSDYPAPFLVSALSSLQHKQRIKQMDYAIATRAIEAILHIKVGDKDFPVQEGDPDIKNLEDKFRARNIVSEPLFRLITNHVTELAWVYPPLEALLSDTKYQEPNSDILMAMGFPRKLLVGEALRSNAGQDTQSTLGPLSTLNEMRRKFVEWLNYMMLDVSDKNGFKHIPTITFAPITVADMSSLASIAVNAVKAKAISRDTLAGMFGTSYEAEQEQLDSEEKHIAEQVKELYPQNDPLTGKPKATPAADTSTAPTKA